MNRVIMNSTEENPPYGGIIERIPLLMNLIHMRYFVELAETGHYTRAAQRLCITQPSLSHAIVQRKTSASLFTQE